MKEGIPVIPGVLLLLPGVATASTFTAGSGNTPSKSRDPRQISPSPPSPLPSSLGSHHTRARSLRAGCPGERGGRVEPSSGQTTHSLHPHQSQPIFSAGPAPLWVCHSELRVGLSSAASTEHRSPVPPATQGSVAPRVGTGRVPVVGMRSTVDERCQCRQAAQRALGRPVLHSKHHTETEILWPPGSPGEVRPSAPPLDSHLAEGREKHKSGRTSDLTQA